MAETALSICNRAIAKIAGDPLDTFSEESPLGAFCQANYPAFKRMMLGKHRWTFANRVALLTRTEPAAGAQKPLAYLFQKPSGQIGAVHAWRDQADPRRGGPVYVMETEAGYWADTATVYVEFTAEIAEAAWPTWFENLVVVAFAAELALNAQNRSLHNTLATQAWGVPSENGEGGLYAQARNEDGRMAPPRQLVNSGVDPGPLVAVRGGGFGCGFGWDGTFIDPPAS